MQDNHPYQKLIIRAIHRETPDSKTFELSPLAGDGAPVYKPGQFLTFAFDTRHGEERRSYSVSSVQGLGQPISITVKRVANGAYSRYFIDHAQIGDILDCVGAAGLFLLPENIKDYKQVFMLAAGSGIVPIMPLIETLLAFHPHIDIVLIYSNKNEDQTIFYDKLVRLASESGGRLIIDFLFSQSNDILKSRLNNSLLTAMLKEHGKVSASEILCFICGPVDYMDTVAITLLTEGIPKANIRKENFVSYLPEEKREPDDKRPHKVHIKTRDGEQVMTVQYPVSILQQAKKQGIRLPYSCESGQCGSCTAKCTQGKVWIAYNEVLTEKELEAGLILTCQGFPVEGDVYIEY